MCRGACFILLWLTLSCGQLLGQVTFREVQREARVLFNLDVPDVDASDEEKAQYKLQSAKVSAILAQLKEKGVSQAKLKRYTDVVVYGSRVHLLRTKERISKTELETCRIRCKIEVRSRSEDVDSLSYTKCTAPCERTWEMDNEEFTKEQVALINEQLRLELAFPGESPWKRAKIQHQSGQEEPSEEHYSLNESAPFCLSLSLKWPSMSKLCHISTSST
jgi:hypothetical protein